MNKKAVKDGASDVYLFAVSALKVRIALIYSSSVHRDSSEKFLRKRSFRNVVIISYLTFRASKNNMVSTLNK